MIVYRIVCLNPDFYEVQIFYYVHSLLDIDAIIILKKTQKTFKMILMWSDKIMAWKLKMHIVYVVRS